MTKVNFQDNVGAAKTDAITTVNALKELLTRNLPATDRDLTAVDKMQPPNPRDYLHRADAVVDPQGEAASIRADLKWILARLAESEALIKENRALLNELLK